jgi:ketosteroid isomerase-like protein
MTDSPNLDLVRSIYANWERGDYFRHADWADPEIEFVIADGPEPGRWRRLAGMADGWRGVLTTTEDLRVEIDGCREIDDERVLVFNRRTGRTKALGLDLANITSHTALIFHVRDGKVTRLVFYWDRNRAFADLGLTPKGEGP